MTSTRNQGSGFTRLGGFTPNQSYKHSTTREWELTLFNLIASPKANELEGRFTYKASPKVNENYTLLTTSPSNFPNPSIPIPWQSRTKKIEQRRWPSNTHRQSNEGNQYKQEDLAKIYFHALWHQTLQTPYIKNSYNYIETPKSFMNPSP